MGRNLALTLKLFPYSQCIASSIGTILGRSRRRKVIGVIVVIGVIGYWQGYCYWDFGGGSVCSHCGIILFWQLGFALFLPLLRAGVDFGVFNLVVIFFDTNPFTLKNVYIKEKKRII